MSLAPIVFFAYNRPAHMKKALDSLAACPEAKDTALYIFSDGAKNEKSKEAVRLVREYLNSPFGGKQPFKEMHITCAKANKGLARSIIAGVTEVIEKHGKAIVQEDDLVVSPHYLKYMNDCLDYFESDKRIGSITGFSLDMRFPENYNSDLYLSYRSCSTGWCTWKNRWENVRWDITVRDILLLTKEQRKTLNRGGNDRLQRLYRQVKGQNDSWSIRFGLYQAINNLYTVYPRYSYIKNVGMDGSGINSGTTSRYEVDINKAVPDPKLENLEVDKRITRTIYVKQSGTLPVRLYRSIKAGWNLKKEKQQ